MTPINRHPAARRAAAGGMPLCGYFAGRGLDFTSRRSIVARPVTEEK